MNALLIPPPASTRRTNRQAVRSDYEAGAILGVGGATYTEEDWDYKFESSGGTYWEAGLVARPVVTLGRCLLFAELGYIANEATYGESAVEGMPGVTMSGRITTSGTFFTVGAGVTL